VFPDIHAHNRENHDAPCHIHDRRFSAFLLRARCPGDIKRPWKPSASGLRSFPSPSAGLLAPGHPATPGLVAANHRLCAEDRLIISGPRDTHVPGARRHEIADANRIETKCEARGRGCRTASTDPSAGRPGSHLNPLFFVSRGKGDGLIQQAGVRKHGVWPRIRNDADRAGFAVAYVAVFTTEIRYDSVRRGSRAGKLAGCPLSGD
jgi:hypothetical protein